MFDYKSDQGGCSRYEMANPICLDFHHPPGTAKEMAVNKMVLYGYSEQKIRAEIDKCELVCANCHGKIHGSEPTVIDKFDISISISESSGDSLRELDRQLPDSVTKTGRFRAWTHLHRGNLGCDRCDEDDPRALQFHHRDDDKTMTVSGMISNSCPEEEVITEVEKCTILCANCHRRIHEEGPGIDANRKP